LKRDIVGRLGGEPGRPQRAGFSRYCTAPGGPGGPPAIACPRPGRRRHPGDLAAVFGALQGRRRDASDEPGRLWRTARGGGQCAHDGRVPTARPGQLTRGPGHSGAAVHPRRCRAAAEDVQDVLPKGYRRSPATDRAAAVPDGLRRKGQLEERFGARAGAGLQRRRCAGS
jgi:hypothetical protein